MERLPVDVGAWRWACEVFRPKEHYWAQALNARWRGARWNPSSAWAYKDVLNSCVSKFVVTVWGRTISSEFMQTSVGVKHETKHNISKLYNLKFIAECTQIPTDRSDSEVSTNIYVGFSIQAYWLISENLWAGTICACTSFHKEKKKASLPLHKGEKKHLYLHKRTVNLSESWGNHRLLTFGSKICYLKHSTSCCKATRPAAAQHSG